MKFTRAEAVRWIIIVAISAFFSWLAIHRANILGREQLNLANKLNMQVNHEDRQRLADEIKAEIRKIHQALSIGEFEREPLKRQNVATDSIFEVRR